MPRKYLFTDESGDLDLSSGQGASRFFILTTVSAETCEVGDRLLELRRDMAIRSVQNLGDHFHATEDKQHVRNEVFAVLEGLDFHVDCTIFEKAKAYARVRQNDEYFYKLACYLHFQHVLTRSAAGDELLVVTASLGTKGKKKVFQAAFNDVVRQCATVGYSTAYWSAASEPCLQAADYCSWAIQRKWERNDNRSYAVIQPKIRSEFDAWRVSRVVAKG